MKKFAGLICFLLSSICFAQNSDSTQLGEISIPSSTRSALKTTVRTAGSWDSGSQGHAGADVYVSCQQGEKILSGGGVCSSVGSAIQRSFPLANGRTWYLSCSPSVGGDVYVTATAFAVCGM